MPIYKQNGKKKDGLQRYKVRINFIDKNGQSKQYDRIAYGIADAKELERKLITETKQAPEHKKHTIQMLFDEYIKAKSIDVRKTTLEKTSSILKREVLPYVGKLKLNKLNLNVLQNWKNEIASKNLAISTKQNIYGEFRALLNYAVKMEYIFKNPLNNLGNFREVYFSMPETKIKFYTPEQFKIYIKHAELEQPFFVFFNIAFYTGMRKGEINALKWSDVDFTNNLINVRRSIAQKTKGGDVETPPKNKTSYRTLQMPKTLIAILNQHKETQKKMYKNFNEDFRVCGGDKCLRDTTLAKKHAKYIELAQLPYIRIHDFRHSHASVLANARINIQEIARRLGHAKIEITWNTYSHLYPKEEERAIEVLDSL